MSPFILLIKNVNSNKSETDRKWKIKYTVLERRKSKTMTSWNSRKRNKAIFCTTISSEGNFFNIHFISVQSVLNTLSEYI